MESFLGHAFVKSKLGLWRPGSVDQAVQCPRRHVLHKQWPPEESDGPELRPSHGRSRLSRGQGKTVFVSFEPKQRLQLTLRSIDVRPQQS